MSKLSKELCEICGIEPKRIKYETETTDGCINLGSKKVYPDFEKPENFVKLFRLITTIEEFGFTTGNFYIPSIQSYRQGTILTVDDEDYYSINSNSIQAFITCVIKHCKEDRDTADYIRKTEWIYE